MTSTGGSNIADASEVTGSSTGATKVVPKVSMNIRDAAGEWNTNVMIPQDTEITKKGGGIFDVTKIEAKLATVSGGLTGYDRSRGAVDFGPTGTPLLFSKPVMIQFYVDSSYTGSTIEVKVRHA
jgi:hypothetical protein